MVTVSKHFDNNSKYFVMCKDCMFFYPQLQIDGADGYCKNEYLFKVDSYYKKHNGIYDSAHTCCGFSLPINADIKPEVYYNQDNSIYDKAIRKDV